ncbi:MAG TPA: DUF3500 domain-containing protein [Gammaproteobacteria bacterium]
MQPRFWMLAPFLLSSAAPAWSQEPRNANPFAGRARVALAEPFVGLTTDGTPVRGLFAIERTGVSTEAVRLAARQLIAALDPEQRERLMFPVDDPEWRDWANVHRYPRQGVSLDEMTEAQREAAFALLRASLSAKGYETSRDIMRLNHHLAELVSNFDEYGEHLYWFTIMGEPSATEPWGWQIDGHHLVVNYFVLGDQVVMTPTFMGSEPVRAESGKYAGTSILEQEQDLAVAFMQSLSPEQRRAAVLSETKRRGENRAEMLRDNVTVPYEGLPATRLERPQLDALVALIGAYVGNMDDGHAALKMEEVRAHLDETYFAWKGTVGPDGVFYYRIQSPVVFIEFDHQGPVALDGPRDVPTRRHVHTVVRTPNGNDYGKDLLRRHYERHAHDRAHGHVANPFAAAR